MFVGLQRQRRPDRRRDAEFHLRQPEPADRGDGATSPIAIAYDPVSRIQQTVAGPSGGQTTTQFLYDGDNLVAEYDGTSGNLLRRYVHGLGTDEPLSAAQA